MALLFTTTTEPVTAWTLRREGHTLTCTLTRQSSGRYMLCLRQSGTPILDEPCGNPHEAVARSVEAFHSFLVRGWQPSNTTN